MDRELLDHAEAQRILGITRKQYKDLVDTHVIATDETSAGTGKPWAWSVTALSQSMGQSFPEVDVPVLMCPLSVQGETAGSLFLDPAIASNQDMLADLNRNMASSGLSQAYGTVPNSQYQGTGAWQVAEDKARDLAAQKGLIVGVIGGLIVEVARVIAYGGAIAYRQRRLFVIEPVSSEYEQQWRGRKVVGMTQTPRFLHDMYPDLRNGTEK